MKPLLTFVALAAGAIFLAMEPTAIAQTNAPAPVASAPLSESTIKALQDALNKQGIVVKADGVLNDETRAAIRKYQSQHHLPVTGDADSATLNKLGVVIGSNTGPAAIQSAQAQPQPGQMPGGMMMNCSMMQGQMQEMMQMMQRMHGMMQMMHGQMQPGQMQPGHMKPGPMQGGAPNAEPSKPN
jgi:hypothetical protein